MKQEIKCICTGTQLEALGWPKTSIRAATCKIHTWKVKPVGKCNNCLCMVMTNDAFDIVNGKAEHRLCTYPKTGNEPELYR